MRPEWPPWPPPCCHVVMPLRQMDDVVAQIHIRIHIDWWSFNVAFYIFLPYWTRLASNLRDSIISKGYQICLMLLHWHIDNNKITHYDQSIFNYWFIIIFFIFQFPYYNFYYRISVPVWFEYLVLIWISCFHLKSLLI